MPSINLAPGTEFIIAARKRRQRLYAISAGVFFVAVAAYAVLFFMQQSLTNQNEQIQANIQQVDAQIQQSKDDATRVSLFEKRLVETKTLLDNHVVWDRIFADVERLMPPNTTLTGFDAGTDASVITVQGTTPDVDSIAQALASLSAGPNHQSVFTSGAIKAISKQDKKNGDQSITSYTFTLTLTIDSSMLRSASHS